MGSCKTNGKDIFLNKILAGSFITNDKGIFETKY